MINGDLLLLTGWWLNHPSEKYYSSQHGNRPQRGVEIKNIWSHHLAIYTSRKLTNSLNKGTILKDLSIFQALFFKGNFSFRGGNNNTNKQQQVTRHKKSHIPIFAWIDLMWLLSAQGGKKKEQHIPPVCRLTLGSPTLSLLLASPAVHTTSLVFLRSWEKSEESTLFHLQTHAHALFYTVSCTLRFQTPRWKNSKTINIRGVIFGNFLQWNNTCSKTHAITNTRSVLLAC